MEAAASSGDLTTAESQRRNAASGGNGGSRCRGAVCAGGTGASTASSAAVGVATAAGCRKRGRGFDVQSLVSNVREYIKYVKLTWINSLSNALSI